MGSVPLFAAKTGLHTLPIDCQPDWNELSAQVNFPKIQREEPVTPMNRIQTFFVTPLLILLTLGITGQAVAQPLEAIPGPSPGNRVIDHARVIPEFAKDQLETLCDEISGYQKSELVILTVQDTGNMPPEKYAVAYFNRWGIGEATNNNGLLVFAAMKQRTAYIAIGDGLASDANNQKCVEIATNSMVSRFKRNDAGGAMFGGGFAAAREILGFRELANRLERETNTQHRLRKQQSSPGRKAFFLWLAGGGVLGVGGIAFFWARYQVRYGSRDCKNCHIEMVLLDEQQDDEHLSSGEQVEEQIGSVDYDVWACLGCDEVLKYRYGRFLTRYSRCPKCRYKTKSKISKTIRAATTSRGGKVRVTESCEHCRYRNTYTYSTPKLPKPSKSSSGGSGGWSISTGSSGGGWGGSSGGGFGGSRGSSSGGGGAKW